MTQSAKGRTGRTAAFIGGGALALVAAILGWMALDRDGRPTPTGGETAETAVVSPSVSAPAGAGEAATSTDAAEPTLGAEVSEESAVATAAPSGDAAATGGAGTAAEPEAEGAAAGTAGVAGEIGADGATTSEATSEEPTGAGSGAETGAPESVAVEGGADAETTTAESAGDAAAKAKNSEDDAAVAKSEGSDKEVEETVVAAAAPAAQSVAPQAPAGGSRDAAPSASAPVFDLVRVEPDGAGLAAGRAAPNAAVEIVIDGEVVGETTTGPDGAFVAFFATPTALAAPEGGSDGSGAAPGSSGEASPGIVTGTAAPEPGAAPGRIEGALEVVARLRADGGPSDGGSGAAGAGTGDAAVSAPVFVLATTGGAGEETAPVILSPGEEGLRIVQPPKAPVGTLTLDAISYDPEGRVVFAGRARPVGEVRLYLDGALAARTPVSDDGSWRAQADEDIRPGVYTLRLDQADEAGAVLSRLETPFQREAIGDGRLGPGAVTIQQGDNLWRIAENYYGSGIRYTVIYGANRAKIRDPDLIYPGQVFTIPESGASD